MGSKILKKIIGLLGYRLIEKNLYKNKRLIDQKNYLNINIVLKKIFSNKNISNVIQIGANDGQNFDELKNHIKEKNYNCLLVEPIKQHFIKLKEYYKTEKNFKFENSAISPKKNSFFIYCVNEKYLNNYGSHITAINSFDKNHLIKHGVNHNHLHKVKVNSISFAELIKKHNFNEIDLIYVDAEGYDAEIVSEFLDIYNSNAIIIFEYIHTKIDNLKILLHKLDKKDYKYMRIGENLICFDNKINLF